VEASTHGDHRGRCGLASVSTSLSGLDTTIRAAAVGCFDGSTRRWISSLPENGQTAYYQPSGQDFHQALQPASPWLLRKQEGARHGAPFSYGMS